MSNGQVQIRMGKWKSGIILSDSNGRTCNGLDCGGEGEAERGKTLEECGYHQRKGSHYHCETKSVA